MNHWLVKSEPFKYSFDQLQKDKRTMWDGVRNFQARNNLMAMEKGDLTLFYHSNEGKEVVGIARVVREHYPDPTAKEGNWVVVDVEPVKKLKIPVTLKRIKSDPILSDIALVRQGRLSVLPLKKEEFDRILELAEGGGI